MIENTGKYRGWTPHYLAMVSIRISRSPVDAYRSEVILVEGDSRTMRGKVIYLEDECVWYEKDSMLFFDGQTRQSYDNRALS